MTEQVEKINISKEGIEIAYRRFLSDSTAGFIILLILILAYYYPVFGIPLNDTNLSEMFHPPPPVLLIFICFLLFVLATTLGLATNAMSYFLFYCRILKLEKYCYDNNSFFITPTKDRFSFEARLKPFFGNECFKSAKEIEMAMATHHQELMKPISWRIGTHIFFRNIALLCIPLFIGSSYISIAKLLSSSISFISIIEIVIWMISPLLIFLLLLFRSERLCISFGILTPIWAPLFIIVIFKLRFWMLLPFIYSAMFVLMFCLAVLMGFYYRCLILSRAYMLCQRCEKVEKLRGDLTKILKYLAKSGE